MKQNTRTTTLGSILVSMMLLDLQINMLCTHYLERLIRLNLDHQIQNLTCIEKLLNNTDEPHTKIHRCLFTCC